MNSETLNLRSSTPVAMDVDSSSTPCECEPPASSRPSEEDKNQSTSSTASTSGTSQGSARTDANSGSTAPSREAPLVFFFLKCLTMKCVSNLINSLLQNFIYDKINVIHLYQSSYLPPHSLILS